MSRRNFTEDEMATLDAGGVVVHVVRTRKRKLCPNTKHLWHPVRGGKRDECETCGTSFPCKQASCGHIDCHIERGEALPDGITERIAS